MARKGENIYKRKDGRWEGRYKSGYDKNGKSKYKSVYAKSYKLCKEKLMAVKNSLIQQKKPINLQMTVKELFEIWLNNISVKIKTTTFDVYNLIIKNHIIPFMSELKICNISPDFLTDFIANKLKNGRMDGKGGLSKKTIMNIICVLKSCFKYAEKIYNIYNPANYIIIPRSVPDKIEVLTDLEIKKLSDYCNKNNNYFSLVYKLCLSTGIRIGELCALQCGDIDFENGILSITKTVQRIKNADKFGKSKTLVVVDMPKTKNSIREIPLTTSLLKELAAYTKNKRKTDYLFTPDGKKSFDVRTIQGRFNTLLKKCGIRKVKFHILRHTFATKWANSNFDIKSLSEILGHSGINITLSLYVHSSMDIKRKNINSLFNF